MESNRYITLSSSLCQVSILRATDALEDAGIPVMVQHVFVENTDKSQYRLLVPDSFSQKASSLIHAYSKAL